MQKIKTFEDACKSLNVDSEKVLPDVSAFPLVHQKALTAAAKLMIIITVLNGSWVPDWNNDDEYKYYPWFDMEKDENNPDGLRLNDVNCYYSASFVGSRLCFKSRDLAEYAAEQFLDLYKDYFLIQ